jgi:hypothetical protein
MYVLYYASILRRWQLVWILVRTNHPFLGVGCHTPYCRVPWHCSGASRVLHSTGTAPQSHCSHMPRVVEPLHTLATHYERATSLCCAGAALQSACPHVLLAFNRPPAPRLAGARRRPCLVAPWKILVCLDGDHEGRVARGYLFTLMARNP